MVGQHAVIQRANIAPMRHLWVFLSDIYHLIVPRPYQVAQNKSAWQAQTCF